MARHSQRPDNSLMVCPQCKADNCVECIDVLRVAYATDTICTCTRRGHAGEPRDSQVLDPETNVVHAPGLTVSQEGTISKIVPTLEA